MKEGSQEKFKEYVKQLKGVKKNEGRQEQPKEEGNS